MKTQNGDWLDNLYWETLRSDNIDQVGIVKIQVATGFKGMKYEIHEMPPFSHEYAPPFLLVCKKDGEIIARQIIGTRELAMNWAQSFDWHVTLAGKINSSNAYSAQSDEMICAINRLDQAVEKIQLILRRLELL